jgi:excisionase family DNA binding protein
MRTRNLSGSVAQPHHHPRLRASAPQDTPDASGKSILEVIRSHRSAMTVDHVAGLLGSSPKSLYKLIKQQRLPCYRVGAAIRLDPQHTANWLQARSTV